MTAGPLTPDAVSLLEEEADKEHNKGVGRYLGAAICVLLALLMTVSGGQVNAPGLLFLLLAMAFFFFGSRHMSQERALRFKVRLDEVQRI